MRRHMPWDSRNRSNHTNWTRKLALGFLLAGALAGAREAAAQGIILPRPLPDVPRPPALTVKRQKVSVRIESGAARTEVEQLFVNPISRVMEGTYLFPLPENAAISNFRMTIDREPVEGRVIDREEARRIYEEYVRRMVDPAILEYVGRNAFRARVFPIPAQGEKEIQIGYSQPLSFESGVYQYTYPLSGACGDGASAGSAGQEVTITVTIQSRQPLRAIYSPTHEIAVRRVDDHTARVSFEARELRSERDFQLYYSVSEKEFGLNLLAHRRGDEPGYFMLMLAPKREIPREEIAPKDIVFVFDTSGSMSGAKIEQAKRALQFILNNLNPHDRFNIIRFNSEVEPFRKGLVEAAPASVEAARDFVAEIKAVGGTAIDDALATSFESLPMTRLASDDGRRTMIVFMTDGQPTIGETNPERILANVARLNRGRARLFVFGVGDDVNTLLLDRLARDGAGTVEYVRPSEDLELKVSAFYNKIAHPVLADLELSLPGAEVTDLYPKRVPDLFAGSQLILFGRYTRPGAMTAHLTGQVAGHTRTFTYPVSLPDRERENGFIPRLWASRKIGYLLEEIRLHGESAELKDEVIRLSKEHGILTPYTAFLVEEPGVRGPDRRLSQNGSPVPPGAAGPPEGILGGRLNRDQGGFAGAAPSDAAAFRRASGDEAVRASQRIGGMKAQSVESEEASAVRRVDARVFQRRGDVWVDAAYTAKMPVIAIKWGSPAYFELLRLRPSLGRVLALGRKLVVVLDGGRALRIDETGKETFSAADRRALGES
jgi:Ca-activated chloride channel family protein